MMMMLTMWFEDPIIKVAEPEMGDLDPFCLEGASECFESGDDGRLEAVVG